MAFLKKIWKDRRSEYPNRRKLTATGSDGEYDVSRSEGLVIEEGDKLDAENLNDFESRVAEAFADVSAQNVRGFWIDYGDAEGNDMENLYVHYYEDEETGEIVTLITSQLWVENKIKESCGRDILWKNAKPTSNFGQQTVDVNYSGYKSLTIYAKVTTSSETHAMVEIPIGTPITSMALRYHSLTDVVTHYSRVVSLVSDGVKFGQGLVGVQSGDNVLIPEYIYGNK